MAAAGKLFEDAFALALRGADGSVETNTAKGLRKLAYHKTVKQHIADASRGELERSENKAIQYMMQDRGMFAAGGDKGREGLANIRGAWQRMRGQREAYGTDMQKFDSNIQSFRDAGAHLAKESNPEQYKAYMAQVAARNEYMRGMGGVRPYTSAATQAMGGALKYMNSGTIAQRAAKLGTGAAAYVGLNGVRRAAFGGGSPFYNSDGQRDIAGIPFI